MWRLADWATVCTWLVGTRDRRSAMPVQSVQSPHRTCLMRAGAKTSHKSSRAVTSRTTHLHEIWRCAPTYRGRSVRSRSYAVERRSSHIARLTASIAASIAAVSIRVRRIRLIHRWQQSAQSVGFPASRAALRRPQMRHLDPPRGTGTSSLGGRWGIQASTCRRRTAFHAASRRPSLRRRHAPRDTATTKMLTNDPISSTLLVSGKRLMSNDMWGLGLITISLLGGRS